MLMRLTPNATLASSVGTATVIVLRLISVRYRLRLPEPRSVEEQA